MNDRADPRFWLVASVAGLLLALGLLSSRHWRPVVVSVVQRWGAREDGQKLRRGVGADEHRGGNGDRSYVGRQPRQVELDEFALMLSDVEPGPSAPGEVDRSPPAESPPAESPPLQSPPPSSLAATDARTASPVAPTGRPGDETGQPWVAKKTLESASAPAPVWPSAKTLAADLEQLSKEPAHGEVAQQAMAALGRLSGIRSLGAAGAEVELQQLRSLAEQLGDAAEKEARPSIRAELGRASYGLIRRLELWELVQKIASRGELLETNGRGGDGLPSTLAAVDALVGHGDSADGWRRFLALERLQALVADDDKDQRRQVARTVLLRMEAENLTPQQRGFLDQPLLQQLVEQLMCWSSEPVDYAALLRQLEDYETEGAAAVANRVAQSYHHLRWSPAPQDRELARRLDTRYRNANVRVAISQELINRLLPSPDEIEGPVREEILGARVVGRSRAKTRLKVTLLPHGRQWRLGLDVEGDVTSDTSATKGPATFFNEGASRFSARKVLLVDDRAVRTRWAAAVADSNEDLIRVRTNYDGLPLLGPVARAVAIRQHDLRRDDAKWETEAKLAAKASSQLDQAVRQQIREAAGRFHAKVLKPLKTIELNPRVMDMETTSERLVARCCLAGDDQLAAQTARPRAFSDSLLSVQIHETGVNNAIEKLQWDGKRANLMDLHHEIAKAFNRPELGVPEDFPKDVTVQFAPAEAVRVRCDNGRAVLTLKLAELAAGHGKRWKDFVVRAYYRPDASDLSARLVRDENFDLIGQRLSLGDRVALRGIFAKVFSRRRPLCIIGQQLAEKPQLQDLHVTQFAVDNGWVGVALGPQRVASNKPTRVAADGREPALTNDE